MCLGPMSPDASDFPGGIPALESLYIFGGVLQEVSVIDHCNYCVVVGGVWDLLGRPTEGA